MGEAKASLGWKDGMSHRDSAEGPAVEDTADLKAKQRGPRRVKGRNERPLSFQKAPVAAELANMSLFLPL